MGHPDRQWTEAALAACGALLDLDDPAGLLAAGLDKGRRALVTALASDRRRPVASVLADLGEILHLPRERRSEYRSPAGGAPPYLIRKLLLEYAVKAKEMDRHVTALTKGYCATRCDRLPTGCCTIQGYDLGLVPEVMLEVQELEARMRGWQPPWREAGCRYHSPKGCVLVLFKSPACLGTLCGSLERHLLTGHPPALAEPYLAALRRFRNCDLDRRSIFEAMDEAIRAGNRLISER